MKINEPVTQSETQFRDGMILASRTDLKGIITYANQAFVDISGFALDELVGKNHNIVRHPDMPPEAFDDLWRTVKAGKPWTGIVKNRCKNGDHYWVKATVTPIKQDGKVVEYMSVRVRPSRAEVEAAENLYHDLKQGSATLKKSALQRVLFRLRSLPVSAKLAAAYTTLVGVVAAVLIGHGTLNMTSAVIERENEALAQRHLALQDNLKAAQNFAAGLAALVAEMPAAQTALADGDRDALMAMFATAHARLKKEFNVKQFQFHTPPAFSFVRIHKPGKFGDDLSAKRPTIVKTNADRAPVTGLDIGPFGLGLRGLTPVFKDGRHLGSVEFGMAFDERFFERFKASHGADVSLDLYRDGGLQPFANTLAERFEPAAEDIARVKAGETVQRQTEIGGTPVSVLRAPLEDFAGEVVGLLQIVNDRSAYVAQLADVRNQSILVAAIALIVGIVVSYLIARGITRPLNNALDIAHAIADGKYDNDIASDRDDETGRLLQAMQTMQSHLNYDVHTVQEALRENLRVRAALDSVDSCVTVSDRDNLLIYMNDAATALFEKLARNDGDGDRKVDVGSLLGTRLSDFFPDEELAQLYREQLRQTTTSELRAWGHTLRLVASPVRDEDGGYQGRVTQWIDRTDELAAQRAEAERLQQERETAAANLRLKVALDNVASNVTVADQDQQVIYVNKAALRMFGDAEAAIRTNVPQFSVDTLVGSSAETLLDTDPAFQPGTLARLDSTTTSEFPLGELTLRAIVNPVVDAEGQRLGTVVEWNNRTDEVAVENEIDGIVEAARAGDLTQRIRLDNKQGFFHQLGTGMNALIDETERVFTDIAEVMNRLAQGDLTRSMTGDYRGTFGQVKNDVNSSLQHLDNVVRELRNGIDEIAHTSAEISSGNTSLSSRTEQQASSLEETAASMEQLTSTVRHNADNAQQANQVALVSRQHAEEGGKVVGEAVRAMEQINAASNKISEIIGVIDDIAFQTNLLALNASVEAARAGEQGRGFAVVATEVRNLASRSADAAKEIKVLIQDSVQKVQAGAELVDRSGASLNEIVTGVKKVGDIVAEIAAASAEQSAGIDQVNKAVTSMDEVTQQNAALAEETSAASTSMAEKARSMTERVGFFRVNESS